MDRTFPEDCSRCADHPAGKSWPAPIAGAVSVLVSLADLFSLADPFSLAATAPDRLLILLELFVLFLNGGGFLLGEARMP